jgi:peptidyl-prolyl cis-trans isomerase SurA
MIKRLFFIITLIFSVLFTACSPKSSELLVAEYGKYDITLPEFEEAYAKNVGGFESAKNDSITDYKKFLDLYVNFRMKLRDAEVRGYSRDEDLTNEVESYKRKVGASYVLEKEFVEPQLKKLYDLRKEEVRVSHIMFRSPEINEEKEKLAYAVLDTILAGADFAEMALKYSDDSYSKVNGGDIFWITAGQIVPEFEKASYATNVGEVHNKVVKTRFGYHILKVTERQPRKYKLGARHILMKETAVTDSSSPESAYYKMNEIRNRILNGEDFADMAKEFSEDPGSAQNGGDLGEFQRRKMVAPFDLVAFSSELGELSEVFKTRFGYHMLEVTKIYDYPSFADEKENLRELYKRTTYDSDLAAFIDSLKTDYAFKVNEDMKGKLINFRDTIRLDRGYFDSIMHEELGSQTIFTINNNPVLVDSMISYGIMERSFKSKYINHPGTVNDLINSFSQQRVLEEKALVLDKTNLEFATLMNDYRNGIFIFKLQEDEVWNRLKIDSVETKKFYDETKANYRWKDRVEYMSIFVKSDSLINVVYEKAKAGMEFSTLAEKYTEKPGMKAKKGYSGLVELEKNPEATLAFQLTKEGELSEPKKMVNGWSIIKLLKKDPARVKTYEEAKPEVLSAYQEMLSSKLEKQYVDKLKKLYEPQINYEVLEKAFVNAQN